jgi:hypothetical protein
VIKEKTTTRKKTPPAPRRVKPAPQVDAPGAKSAPTPGELQRAKDELQQVNRQLSKLGQLARPGSNLERHQPLPEKQALLQQKVALETRIRALARSR